MDSLLTLVGSANKMLLINLLILFCQNACCNVYTASDLAPFLEELWLKIRKEVLHCFTIILIVIIDIFKDFSRSASRSAGGEYSSCNCPNLSISVLQLIKEEALNSLQAVTRALSATVIVIMISERNKSVFNF